MKLDLDKLHQEILALYAAEHEALGEEGTLELLEKEGVEILSCGTCLAFYGLTDQLKVGKVTNMYETVSSLLASDKIIKI